MRNAIITYDYASMLREQLRKTRPKNIKQIHVGDLNTLVIYYWGRRPHKWILKGLASIKIPLGFIIQIDWHNEGSISGCSYRIAPNGVCEGLIDGHVKYFNVLRTERTIWKNF